MGNCCGSEEEPDAPLTQTITPQPSGVKNYMAPMTAPPLTRVVPRPGDGGDPIWTLKPPRVGVGKIITPDLKTFGYSELKSATRNFRPDSVVGEGGFGRVYKGWIDATTMAPSKAGVGTPIAVKRCNADSLQGHKEWKTEIEFLGKFCHPNLVRLIGYCWEDKELLLIYEYVQKGSLENHLFRKNVEPLSWATRIRIAIDAARGLDFLHTTADSVIYRDFKAANILLDENYVAKLSDFGLARLGPPIDKSHVTTQAVGTLGYAAPEYVNTGHLYVKSDVYGFGVVLLELLTGLRAYDINRPAGQTCLVDWYRPILYRKSKLKKTIDPRMEDFPSTGINKLVELILSCVEEDPKKRPPMSEVLSILENISNIKVVPKNPKSPKPVSSKVGAHAHHKKPTTKGHQSHIPSQFHHHHTPRAPPPPLRHNNHGI